MAPGRWSARERDPLLDWDEDERLGEWCGVLLQTNDLPPVLQAIVAVDAWNELAVLQHAPWLGRLLASILRQASVTTAAYLVAFNLGLRSIPVDRRRHRDRETRLQAIVHGLIAAAELGLKEHDRLALARQMMERKLTGRRTSSKLPELIELVTAKPLVSAGMVVKTLEVTPQAARRIVVELGLCEIRGGGGFGRGELSNRYRCEQRLGSVPGCRCYGYWLVCDGNPWSACVDGVQYELVISSARNFPIGDEIITAVLYLSDRVPIWF